MFRSSDISDVAILLSVISDDVTITTFPLDLSLFARRTYFSMTRNLTSWPYFVIKLIHSLTLVYFREAKRKDKIRAVDSISLNLPSDWEYPLSDRAVRFLPIRSDIV